MAGARRIPRGAPGGLGGVFGPGSLDGENYQQRFDALAAEGKDVHGEARFILSYSPESVLDAGCGTGRVALELARNGVLVVAVDRERSMLAVAASRAAGLERELDGGLRLRFVEADLTALDLESTFDVAVMAGNVPLFADQGTEHELVERVAHHLRPGGLLVAGFQLDRSYGLERYDLHCAAARLELAERYSTWSRDPYVEGGGYAVSVHRRVVGQFDLGARAPTA